VKPIGGNPPRESGGGRGPTVLFEPHRDLLVRIRAQAGGTVISQYDYTSDALGRRTGREDSGVAFGVAVGNEFGYNHRSEVIAAMMGGHEFGYAFDAIGNRTSSTNGLAVVSYAANALNQYTEILNGAPEHPVHDDDGNLTSARGWTLIWDGENRLAQISNFQFQISYTYDHRSRRMSRTEYVWADGGWQAAGVTRFDYDGWALIRERTTDDGESTERRYYHGLDLSGTMQGAGTIGGIWLSVGDEGALYYTYDGNGNVSELLDGVGAIRAHYAYDPFGGLTAMTGDHAAANPIRFSTKRQDEATGWLYYGYRDLDPVWGRWLNRDPIEERGGFNVYAHTNNSPMSNIDKLGLFIGVYPPQPPSWGPSPSQPTVEDLIARERASIEPRIQKLARRIRSMCPPNNGGVILHPLHRKPQCCERESCLNQADRIAKNIITDWVNHRIEQLDAWGSILGGREGNTRLYHNPDKPGRNCTHWAWETSIRFQQAVQNEYSKGELCFRSKTVYRGINRPIVAFYSRHHVWIMLYGPYNRTLDINSQSNAMILDPWYSAGRTFHPNEHITATGEYDQHFTE
jgi:RHS repeat-associated protein